jgi:hypothetical protein
MICCQPVYKTKKKKPNLFLKPVIYGETMKKALRKAVALKITPARFSPSN